MNDTKSCPVCKGQIILDLRTGTRYGTMANGSLTSDGGYTVAKSAYCGDCGVVLRSSILGDFIIIKEKPYWKPRTDEICGSKCRHFTSEKCWSSSRFFTHEGEPACIFYC